MSPRYAAQYRTLWKGGWRIMVHGEVTDTILSSDGNEVVDAKAHLQPLERSDQIVQTSLLPRNHLER